MSGLGRRDGRPLLHKLRDFFQQRASHSLYLLPPHSRLRLWCQALPDSIVTKLTGCCVVISLLSAAVQAVTVQGWFDFVVLVFIAGNCITLAMERPTIPPWSTERRILTIANHVFTAVFALEMATKVMERNQIHL